MSDVALNDDLLSQMMEDGKEMQDRKNPPVLKQNYEEDLKGIPKGMWITGQKKDQAGTVTNAGKIVGSLAKGKRKNANGADQDIIIQKNAIVILAVKNRYNYYCDADKTKNCSSPLFSSYQETVKGSNHGYVCGKECPYRQLDKDKCSAQHVVFGVSFDKGGNEEPFVSYVKGKSWMPFADMLKSFNDIEVKKADGTTVVTQMPTFSHKLNIGSFKEKNGSLVFFPGHFEIGDMVSGEEYARYKRDSLDLLDKLASDSRKVEKQDAIPPKAQPAIEGESQSNPQPAIGGEVEDDIPIDVGMDDEDIIDIPAEEVEVVEATTEDLPFEASTEQSDLAADLKKQLENM